MRVRECRYSDHEALRQFGYTPDVLAVLCPNALTRFLWRIHSTHVRSFLGEEMDSCLVLGSVQFVRSRLDCETWIFGHWKVATGLRRRGIGGQLLLGALNMLPDARRIYSLVELGNDTSIHAHERLGFEASSTVLGGVSLGELSTIGPPAPPAQLQQVHPQDMDILFAIYRRAMGGTWMRLFPKLDFESFLRSVVEPPGGIQPAPSSAPGMRQTLSVAIDGYRAGFVVRAKTNWIFFSDPEHCSPSVLARTAGSLLTLGANRADWIALRGLPRALLKSPRGIAFSVLMGCSDRDTLKSSLQEAAALHSTSAMART